MKSLIALMFCFLSFCSNNFAQEVTKQEKGYFNLTEIGYYFSQNSFKSNGSDMKNGAYALSIRNINGIFLQNNISLGVGVGLDGYTYNISNSSYDNTFLVFADVRFYFKNETRTPFIYADLGNSVSISDNIEKGLFYAAGAGYKFLINNKIAMNGSLGYSHQNINKNSPSLKVNYSSFSIRVGLLF